MEGLREQGWAVRLGRLRWDAFITGWQLEIGGKEWSWCWCVEASENAMRERRGRDTGCWCGLLVLEPGLAMCGERGCGLSERGKPKLDGRGQII